MQYLHQLINFKIIHRSYASPYKLYRITLISNLSCTLCPNSSVETVLHMFWECAKVNLCTLDVCVCVSDIMGKLLIPMIIPLTPVYVC